MKYMPELMKKICDFIKGNCLARCLRNSDGTSAIEFAVVAPVLIFIICAEFAFGMVMFESSVLQGALTNVAREGAIGVPDPTDAGASGGARWKYVINNVLNAQVGALLNKTKITFTATAYPNFASAVAGTGGTANSLGAAGQVVVYSASYPFVPMPFVRAIFGNAASITANSIVKNEPF